MVIVIRKIIWSSECGRMEKVELGSQIIFFFSDTCLIVRGKDS